MDTLTYTSNITNPGQVIIEEVTLVSYNGFNIDLRPYLIQAEITENIINGIIYGSVLISESLNLIKHVPIIGNETIRIVFYTPGNPKTQAEFSLYKISRRIIDGSKSITYLLNFCSKEYIKSLTNKISKSFTNKSYLEMINSIYDNYISIDKFLITDSSASSNIEKKSIVIPFMTPIEAINMISSKIIDNNRNANYVFYTNLSNFYYCVPLFDTNSQPKKIYTTFLPNLSNSLNQDIEKLYSRILEIEVLSSADTIKNITNGVYSSKLLTTDLTYKEINEIKLNYNIDFYESNHINPHGVLPVINEPFTYNSYCHYKHLPQSSYIYDNIKNNDDSESYSLPRTMQLMGSSQFKVCIKVYGDNRRTIGDIVSLNINTPEPVDTTDQKYDPYISGNYLVFELKHIIRKDSYTMDMTLIKDSISKQYPDIKEIQ